jgi:chaperonin GroES
MLSFVPVYDNIVVKPIKAEEKTASGLYIANPDMAKEYAEGIVLAVGAGYRNTGSEKLFPLTVKVGDHVLYRKSVEILVKYENEELFLMSEATVIAIKS